MSTSILGSRALRIIRYLYVTAGSALFILLTLVATNSYLITSYRVQGQSMLPTLRDRQFLPVSRISYSLGRPAVGDIVVVRFAGDSNVTFVKRITAVPGDQIIYQGRSMTLGPDSYFVEGDNRDHSTDSRTYGPIQSWQIVGKVVGHFAAAPQ